MPTGYTEIIDKDCTFQEFTIRCARAMMPLVSIREEPLNNGAPKKLKSSSYHKNKIAELINELKDLSVMSVTEAKTATLKEHTRRTKAYLKNITEKATSKHKHERMLEQVYAWQPPTTQHYGLKKLMLEQLTLVMRDDYEQPKPVCATGHTWRNIAVKEAQRQLDYHEGQSRKEEERTAFANKWLAQLRESISVASSAFPKY